MRAIVFSSGSERKFRRFARKHPGLRSRIDATVAILRKDPFAQAIGAHKLSGRLEKCYGADITFQYRIVYRFDDETLCLLNIGTHDEAY